MTKYLIGYDITGHIAVEATNPQAAAAAAIAIVKAAAHALEAHGEVEYRAPYGGVIDVSKKHNFPMRLAR